MVGWPQASCKAGKVKEIALMVVIEETEYVSKVG